MTRFERAHAYTMRWEGGRVDDPDDPGGATNAGISLRFLRQTGDIDRYDHDGDGDIDAADVMALTDDQIETLYREHFWLPVFDDLPFEAFAIKLYDFGVNVGLRQMVKFAQFAYNDLEIKLYDDLYVDGIMGPITSNALKQIERDDSWYTLRYLEDRAARFYFSLAYRRRRSRKYLLGWLRRAYARP